MSDRPNILFLMSDEHRPDVTGYEGNAIVRTPTLDYLAETGVVFRNAYAPSPICVPSRQCMLAGQLPKTCHCEGWIGLEPGYMTFPRRLAQHAYETVACGKLHLQGTDQLQGFTQRCGALLDCHVTQKYIAGRDDAAFERCQRPFHEYKWSDAREIRRAGVGNSPCMVRDRYAAEGACLFVDEWFNSPYFDREQSRKPLLLKVSMLQPHYPYQTTEERFGYYLNRVPLYREQAVADHPFLSRRQVRIGEDVREREVRRAVAAYYGMVETVDDHFADVVERLEHVGEDLDDWIVVYTADHGEMLGEHGIWEKQKFYEASCRVPLIVRWPKRFAGGRVIDENVSLCDLFATLCDLVGVPVPEGLDSRSLVPLLDGNGGDWDNEVVSQFGQDFLMIKHDALKYQWYGADMPEVLFDLAADPGERTNVADVPVYAGAMDAFRRRRGELGHGPDADADYANAGY